MIPNKALASATRILISLLLCCMCTHAESVASPPDRPTNDVDRLSAILAYISASWSDLKRSTTTCVGVEDSKLTEASILYLPSDFPTPAAIGTLSPKCLISVEHLPSVLHKLGEVQTNGIQPPGLLYLENPYVVPGGRFNEMYGWDSYFIIRGLLRAGKIELARGMVDNFFFEIEHYGGILNANRTYYLTRSQPPFLSSMIVAVYEAEEASGKADPAWLSRASHYIAEDYKLWTQAPHLAGDTGLSRYYDFGDGPVPEGLHDEVGYYHDVLAYFVRRNMDSPYLVESTTADSLRHPEYSLKLCEDNASAANPKCDLVKHVALSSEYYKGDRSMRESGFDITFRFGPYGADTHHYAPVCLNSLLYKTETDMEKISGWLGDSRAVKEWHNRGEQRRKIIQTLLWNDQDGLFFDYDFSTKKLSSYEYASTFYPLLTGAATPEQARAVVHNLRKFEQPGGLAMSTHPTGVQWDYPYGWAPIQLIAVEGMRRYGYDEEANRISFKFLSLVLSNFERDGNIREKYNVVNDSSNIELTEGYRNNVIGFGWTNAVFLELLANLPQDLTTRLRNPPKHDRQD